jgi:hypothetical protein
MFCNLDKLLKINRLIDQGLKARKMDTIKIKNQLRRVMSDRALKIVKCSQTKVTTKLSQLQNDLSNSSILSSSQNDLSILAPNVLQTKFNSRLLNGSILLNKNLTQNNNKITLQPFKTVGKIIFREFLI